MPDGFASQIDRLDKRVDGVEVIARSAETGVAVHGNELLGQRSEVAGLRSDIRDLRGELSQVKWVLIGLCVTIATSAIGIVMGGVHP